MSSPSSRTVDLVCEMGDEEFRDLLDELVYKKPQSALARELCADASKDESFQSPPHHHVLSSLHSASSAAGWKSNGPTGSRIMACDQVGNSSRKSGSSSRNHRTGRLDEGHAMGQDQNAPTSSSNNTFTSTSSSLAAAATTTTCSSASCVTSSSSSSDPQARPSASHHHHASSKDSSNHRPNSSNVNKSDCDVESGRSDPSSRIYTPSLLTYSKTSNSSSSSSNDIITGGNSRTYRQPPAGAPPVHVCREENLVELLDNAVEMQDLRKKAEIVPISSLNGNRYSGPHDVDSVVHFNKLDSRSTIDPQYAELCHLPQEQGSSSSRNGVAAYDQQQERMRHGVGPNNDSEPSVTNRSGIASAKPRSKNKKKEKGEVVKAGELPGNIGDKDVDYLTHYVIGHEAGRSSTAVSRRDRKVTERSKDNKKKAPERSNSQPESSSSEEKVVDKMPKGRSTSPLDHRPSSPSHATSVASYAADEFILRDEFSDDEKGYHTDQDSGFQLMIGKRRYNRHNNRMSRLPVTRQSVQPNHHRPSNSAAVTATPSSPTASSPSFSTAAFSVSGASASASGSVNLTSRGYESEKEFYQDNYSNRQTAIRRRKTASSMPHSARNSPENSDVDSSLSLPIVHRIPPPAPPPVAEDEHSGRISYAQIARSASAASAAPVTVPAPAARSNAAIISSGSATTDNPVNGAVALSTGANGGKSKVQEKAVSHKSNVATENTILKDKAANEGQELATVTSKTPSEMGSAAPVVGVNESSDDVMKEVTPQSRSISSDTPTSGSAAADNRQQIRKHNSIPETAFKSMITTKTLNRSLDSARPPPELPAVIMCDENSTSVTQTTPNGLPSTAVTFGFFDDFVEDDKSSCHANGNQNAEQESLKVNHSSPPLPPNPHVISSQVPDVNISQESVPAARQQPQKRDKKEVKEKSYSNTRRVSGSSSISSYPPDVDIETFNYNEILAYIRKAWESVIRTDGTVYVRSFSSGSITTPEKTSLA